MEEVPWRSWDAGVISVSTSMHHYSPRRYSALVSSPLSHDSESLLDLHMTLKTPNSASIPLQRQVRSSAVAAEVYAMDENLGW